MGPRDPSIPPPKRPVVGEPFQWVQNGKQFDLMYGGAQVGALNADGFRPRVGDGWGAFCEPPIPPPEGVVAEGADRKCRCQHGHGCKCNGHCRCGGTGAPNYGVDREHMRDHTRERITVNGREVTGAEADELIGGPSLPEDAKRPWAVYVAKDDADAAQARTALAPFADKWRVFVCKQSDWYAADRGSRPVFAPGLTCVTPDGRQMRVVSVDALRQVPPDFDPLKTPVFDPSHPKPPEPGPQPSPTPSPTPPGPPWCCVIAMGIIAASLLKKHRS